MFTRQDLVVFTKKRRLSGVFFDFFYSPLEEYPLGGGGNAFTPSRLPAQTGKRATPQEGNYAIL